MIEVPDRFLPLRAVQSEAVEQIVDAWSRVPVVIWGAPTGTGKTIGAIAAAQAREAANLLYVCSGKQLQEQFARDFPDAAVLKGRSNYTPQRAGPFTCADCNKMGKGENAVCSFCPEPAVCPYTVAKQDALRGPLTCVNTSYLITEANGPGGFSGRFGTVVLDEADELEGELKRQLEFRVARRVADGLGMVLPKKSIHRSTMQEWLQDCSVRAARAAAAMKVTGEWSEDATKKLREKQRLMRLAQRASQMAREYDETWVRTYDDDDALTLKPVVVDGYGGELLWRHADRFLLMSATVIAPEMFASELGIEEWEYVDSPSTFPARNRPVVLSGVATLTRDRLKDPETMTKVADAVQTIVDRHEGQNVLVHTHTYRIAEELVGRVKPGDGRRVWTYRSSRERETKVEMYRRRGGVMIAPSLTRGVDLPDDLCRVQIIVKAPLPYIGDPQVSKRMHPPFPNGQIWYDMQAVREVVQMTGRAVRHEDDWAVTYVIDGGFARLYGQRKGMFPAWWREGVVLATTRQVLEGDLDLFHLNESETRSIT